MKSKVRIGFRSKTQMPLLLIWREYYNDDGKVEYAKVIFVIY